MDRLLPFCWSFDLFSIRGDNERCADDSRRSAGNRRRRRTCAAVLPPTERQWNVVAESVVRSLSVSTQRLSWLPVWLLRDNSRYANLQYFVWIINYLLLNLVWSSPSLTQPKNQLCSRWKWTACSDVSRRFQGKVISGLQFTYLFLCGKLKLCEFFLTQ